MMAYYFQIRVRQWSLVSVYISAKVTIVGYLIAMEMIPEAYRNDAISWIIKLLHQT